MLFTIAAARGGRRVAAVLLGLLIAACSPTVTVTPTTTVTPSPSPSPSASAAPTASPSAWPTASPSPSPESSSIPSAAADPAEGLAIAAPYTLTTLDPLLEASFRQQFTASLGALSSLIGIGARQVASNGSLVGYVLVIGFPTGIMNDAQYQSIVDGIASSSAVTFQKTTVSGVEVSSGSMATGGIGLYRAGDNVIITITPTASNLTEVTTALVTANH